METVFIGKSDEAMISEIEEINKRIMPIVEAKYPEVFKKMGERNLVIDLAPRMRTCGGVAYTFTRRIRLNYRLHKENPQELEKTYVHELVHILADIHIDGNAGHGKHWKAMMVDLGQEPEVCHDMKVSHMRRPQRVWLYSCDCPGKTFRLKTVKHNRHQRSGERHYHCPTCKCDLNFEGEQ